MGISRKSLNYDRCPPVGLEPVLQGNLHKYCVFLRLYALFDEADANNMPSSGLISAHSKKCEMQNEREIRREIAHGAAAVRELFGGPYRSPVESPFVNCGVFAVTCALFAGSDMLTLWRRGGSGTHFYISRM